VQLQVQLHRRARRFGGDGVEVGLQVFGHHLVLPGRVVAGDVQPHRFAAQREHLLVQGGVAAVGGQRVDAQMPVFQRRQDPDHGEHRVEVAGLGPGDRQLVEQMVLQVPPFVAGQRPGREVQLEVPAAQLGLELAGPDGPQHVGRRVRGPEVGPADQVQLHLDPGHRLVPGERVLAQHDGQHVQTLLHLGPELLPIPSTERGSADVLAHASTASLCAPGPGWPR
jgi:hypothetical protein